MVGGDLESRVTGQILVMRPEEPTSPTQCWLWTSDYACFDPLKSTVQAQSLEGGSHKSLVICSPGELIHPINPDICSTNTLLIIDQQLLDAKMINDTWSMEGAELATLTSTLFDSISTANLSALEKHSSCDQFPYRNRNSGAAVTSVHLTQFC